MLAVHVDSLSKKYPIMFGGFTDGADVNIEGFKFASNDDLILAGNSNDPLLTSVGGTTPSTIFRKFIGYLESGDQDFKWLLELPSAVFDIGSGGQANSLITIYEYDSENAFFLYDGGANPIILVIDIDSSNYNAKYIRFNSTN
jgi:hypothetical protein